MSRASRGAIVISLSLAFLIGQWGCALVPQPPPPLPSEQMRAQFGTIGVVSARFIPEAEFRDPARGWAGGAGRGAALGAGRTVGTAFEIGVHGRELGVLIMALGIALAPVGALVGSVVGGATAEPAAKVEEAEAALKNALAALKIQEGIRDRVLQVARDDARRRFVLLPELGPDSPGEEVPYPSLASEGIDTVLEVSVPSLGLAGEWTVNPPLTLVLAVRSRLIRVADGTVLDAHALAYRSEQRVLSEWGANNAQPFHDALDRAYQSLAEKIVEDLFLLYLPPETRGG